MTKLVFDKTKAKNLDYVIKWVGKYRTRIEKLLGEEAVINLKEDYSADTEDEECMVPEYLEMLFVADKFPDNTNLICADDSNTKIFTVASYTGGEGQGEDTYVIFAIADKDAEVISHYDSAEVPSAYCYIRTTGWYGSYVGTEWSDDWEFVKPRQITNVIFESDEEIEESSEEDEDIDEDEE